MGVRAVSPRPYLLSHVQSSQRRSKTSKRDSVLLREERVPKNIGKSDMTSLCFLRENGAGGSAFLGDIFSVPNCVHQ